MVVLAASILTKTGKVLVSRQFVDMTRIRIEGLLAAFPKLVGSGKQHTFVETENVRYVYHPMEGLYVVLVTNKQSNILEDLETLRLLSKLVPDHCPGLDEESVSNAAFELIFSFDEVISLGFKENVSVDMVKQYVEMESAAEKQYKADLLTKINETKDLMKKKASEIEKSKADRKDKGISSLSSLSGGPGATNYGNGMGIPVTSAFAPAANVSAETRPSAKLGAPSRGMGMQLGKAQKANQFLESLKAEGEVIVEDALSAVAGGPGILSKAGASAAAISTDPVSIMIEEKLVVVWRRDGGCENMEVQGNMSLTVLKEEDAYLRIQVDGCNDRAFQFKTHPNIDKGLYTSQSVLGLKDPNRPFPTGNPLGILKWRMQAKDDSLVPISINCWPSVSGADTYVNIEYESTDEFDLQNVMVSIPLPPLRQQPVLKDYSGMPRYDARRSVLDWYIELIDNSNRSGSMEFVVPAADTNAFFPIEVKFSSTKTFCNVKVLSAIHATNGSPAKYASSTIMEVESYQVV